MSDPNQPPEMTVEFIEDDEVAVIRCGDQEVRITGVALFSGNVALSLLNDEEAP